MLSGQIDVTGSSKVVWPVRDADIIALGESYLAFEQTRATALQLRDPDPHLVRQVLKSATTAAQAAISGEQARATSAVTYTQALEESKRLLDLALPQLKGKHVKNLAELQAYGLDTKNGARGGVLVARPTNDKGWIKFLVAYAEQEAALPQTDRIVDPPLAHMQELAAIVQANLAARQQGSTQRQMGVQTRSGEVSRLLDILQTAAFVLVVTRLDGHVAEDLQQWGYQIVRKTGPAPLPAEPPVQG